MLKIANNPTLKGLSEFFPGITYSTATGTEIKLDLIRPQVWETDKESRFPLIVFIQGSAWHFPNVNYEIPQLAHLSQQGYVIATVTHRNISEGHPAPAFLQDVKTAIRFLRTNAAEYHIDPDKVYAFGTSSGGNTALLLGLTGDQPEYRTSEYPDVSDHVDAVIDCFGPTDIMDFLQGMDLTPFDQMPMEQIASLLKSTGNPQFDPDSISLFMEFCGGKLDLGLLHKMSPIHHVTADRSYVPFLIAHGDCDDLVDIQQSVKFVKRMEECGADISFVVVEGAEHEGSFWSAHLWEIFKGFLDKQAGK